MNIIDNRKGLSGDSQYWRKQLEIYSKACENLLHQTPRSSDCVGILQNANEMAEIAAGLADTDTLSRSLHIVSLTGASAMLACRFRCGEIYLKGEINRVIPAGASSFLPPLWFRAVCASCLTRDRDALAILCHYEHVNIMLNSIPADAPIGGEPFWKPLCQAFAALISGNDSAAKLAESAADLLSHGYTGAIIPEYVENVQLPILNLISNLSKVETESWTSSVISAVDRFDNFYSSGDRAYFSGGFFPIGIAAICAMANDRGIIFEGESLYLPHWLIHNNIQKSESSVTYVFPSRAARNSQEIHWFFDLEGVPSSGREHQLFEQDQSLVARYFLEGWSGVPHARADFICDDKASASVLLDAGELMLVSDLHASLVDADPLGDEDEIRMQRYHLQSAIEAIEVILSLIPPTENHVPEQFFRSARGGKLRDEEPGRFELDRLQAVKLTYKKIIHKLDECLTKNKNSDLSDNKAEANEQYRATAAMEIIKAQVTPVLQAMARDKTGEVIRMLMPRESDYEIVFTGVAVEMARKAYRDMWNSNPQIKYPDHLQTELHCFIAPAGMLTWENELSWNFPGGYRKVARWLNPNRVWVAWKFVVPGESTGMAYNGLVWCDDHWAWFPKPYQALSGLKGDQQQ